MAVDNIFESRHASLDQMLHMTIYRSPTIWKIQDVHFPHDFGRSGLNLELRGTGKVAGAGKLPRNTGTTSAAMPV